MRHFFLLIAAFLTVGLSLNAQSLKGTVWILESIDDIESGKSTLTQSKLAARLSFDSDSLFSGVACNHYDGNYKAGAGKTLKMVIMVRLKAACLGMGTFEKDLLDHYEKAQRYRLDEGKLFIFTSESIRLVYKKEKVK